MKSTIHQIAILSILSLLLASAASAQSSFTEDFTTTEYKGSSEYFTAIWDTETAQLKHPPFISTQIGEFDPSGDNRGVIIDGNLAYMAAGYSGLHVLDISDPTTPVLLDTYNTPGYAYAVTFKERFIFVADWDNGVQIIDAFDPSNLQFVTTYNTAGSVLDIDISGSHLFLGDGGEGLTILDIQDPYDPTLLGNYNTAGDAARGLQVFGNYAYVTDGNAGLQIIDISDRTQPTLTGTFNTPGYAYDVVLSGNHAYVSDQNNGLVVVNISDPSAPYQAGSLAIAGSIHGITVRGNAVFLSASTTGLLVIDISDPSQPTLQETFDTPGHAQDVMVSGNLAYVADTGQGLKVIEIVDPDVFGLAGSLDTAPWDRNVWVEGPVAYQATGAGFMAVDVSSPWNPQVLDSVGGSFFGVQVAGTLAYVAGGNLGLQVFDVSDPENMVSVGSFDAEYISDCVIDGSLAYCKSHGTMRVLDISKPAAISEIGSLSFSGSTISDIAILGRFAIVANQSQGLRIINIAEPDFPVLITTYATQGTAYSVKIDGDFAYVGCYNALEIVDISNPLNPVQAAIETHIGLNFRDVDVKGNFAYTVNDSSFIRYDITDPTSPQISGTEYHVVGQSFKKIHVDGDYAYLISAMYGESSTTGLEILQISQRSVPSDDIEVLGYSTSVTQSQDNIVRARALWEGAMNGIIFIGTGAGAEYEVGPGEWSLVYPTTGMYWYSRLRWEPNVPRPFLSQITVEWLNAFAPIKTLVDAPADQGRWVRLNIDRSGYDFAEETDHPVTGYQVYRQVNDPGLKNLAADGTEHREFPTPETDGLQRWTFEGRSFAKFGDKTDGDKAGSFPAGIWEAVTWVAATQSENYTVAVPTVADSTVTGNHWSYFLVTTHTTAPADWYISHVSRVQSIDNITPEVPQNLVASYAANEAHLDWDDSLADDFGYHRVYRGSDPDFVPGESYLIAETVSSSWSDVISNPTGYQYKVTTLDHAGNESDAAPLEITTDTPNAAANLAMKIHGAAPNPFNPATTISYSTPRSGTVHLAIYDLAGRQIKELVSGHQEAGEHSIAWNGGDNRGRTMAAGVYVCHLRAQGKSDSQTLVLVK